MSSIESTLSKQEISGIEWKMRTGAQLIACRDEKLFAQIFADVLAKATAEGIDRAADLVQQIADTMRSAADPSGGIAHSVHTLDTAVKAIRSIRGNTDRMDASSLH